MLLFFGAGHRAVRMNLCIKCALYCSSGAGVHVFSALACPWGERDTLVRLIASYENLFLSYLNYSPTFFSPYVSFTFRGCLKVMRLAADLRLA